MRAASIFPLTALLGAFLLFLIQPLLAKQILPWFGGSASVWSTAQVFFQVGLVIGYAYAHLTKRFGIRLQVRLHAVLLILALGTLPISIPASWQPADASAPAARLLLILVGTVGVPYVLLSATAPLLQDWYAGAQLRGRPYRLYVYSNIGSLAALLIYPAVIEPQLGSAAQAWAWSSGFALFLVLCLCCAAQAARTAATADSAQFNLTTSTSTLVPADCLLWLGLSACGSALLLAVTNRMSQDIAPVPLLWVVPLSLYLLTFVLAFAGWYRRGPWILLFIIGAAAHVFSLLAGPDVHIATQIGALGLSLTAACMLCHGELVELRPPVDRLTTFYLWMAVGGAAGGMFVALAAPVIFASFAELALFMLLTPALFLAAQLRHRLAEPGRVPSPALVAGAVGFAALALSSPVIAGRGPSGTVASSRSFYGLLRVVDDPPAATARMRRLFHGRILHGAQWLDAGRRRLPTAYYGQGSGIHLAIDRHPKRRSQQAMSIGMIGLGVGASAAWLAPGDRMTVYELDPDVAKYASAYFSFLQDARGSVDVVLGDGRLSLQREQRAGLTGRYDVLAIDAFSGDSVPVHLLTREAFRIYGAALAAGGLLAIHISNHHLDLAPVVRGLAADLGLASARIRQADTDGSGAASDWMLVGADVPMFGADTGAAAVGDVGQRQVIWTDDFSSLLHVLR